MIFGNFLKMMKAFQNLMEKIFIDINQYMLSLNSASNVSLMIIRYHYDIIKIHTWDYLSVSG